MAEKRHAIHNPSSADYWLHCGHWYHHKIAAEAKGENWNPDSDASRRGHLLHDIAEQAMRDVLGDTEADSWSVKLVEDAVEAAIDRLGVNESVTALDFEDLVKALCAVLQVIETISHDGEVTVKLEQEVPLSHEPESVGTVDVQIISPRIYCVLDYKFGKGEVPEDADQFFVYASNAAVGLEPRREVWLGVVQPQLREEALIHETTWDELTEFRGHVNHTVRKQKAGAVYAPAELSTCDWCPFKGRCVGYVSLVSGAAETLFNITNDAQIEWVVANRTAITQGVETLADVVKQNPERFPNWSRKEVENAAKWNPGVEMGEIAHQLRIKGVAEPYTLRPPGEILKEYPDLAGTVKQFVLDRGSHVRLFRPKSAPALSATIRTRELLDKDEPKTEEPKADVQPEAPKTRRKKAN